MRKFLIAGLVAVVWTAPLAAQDLGAHPASARGRRSIALGVSGGPTIGYWSRHSDRTDLGLDVAVTTTFGDTTDDFSFALQPALKRYLRPTGPLAPYAYFAVPLTFSRIDFDVDQLDDRNQFGVGLTGAFGVDWFPLRQVSIGGHVGLRGLYQTWDDGSAVHLGTVSSGIRVHLYF